MYVHKYCEVSRNIFSCSVFGSSLFVLKRKRMNNNRILGHFSHAHERKFDSRPIRVRQLKLRHRKLNKFIIYCCRFCFPFSSVLFVLFFYFDACGQHKIAKRNDWWQITFSVFFFTFPAWTADIVCQMKKQNFTIEHFNASKAKPNTQRQQKRTNQKWNVSWKLH